MLITYKKHFPVCQGVMKHTSTQSGKILYGHFFHGQPMQCVFSGSGSISEESRERKRESCTWRQPAAPQDRKTEMKKQSPARY